MRLFGTRFGKRSRQAKRDPPDPRTSWPAQPVPDDAETAAGRFWHRWNELLPDISVALGENDPQRVEHQMCAAVALLHPRLHFSLERGQRAIYALVISGQEDPELRPYTDAWIAAAPAEDAIWEYHDSVPPVPDPTEVTVNLGRHRVLLAQVLVAVRTDVDAGVVDVEVYHPVLGELDEASRTAMTFLPLDATLGERVAAHYLRRVEAVETAPAGAIGLLELRELVDGLRG